MFEKLINRGNISQVKSDENKKGQVSFVTPTKEWLPQAIKSMQEGNAEEIERLPSETPLKSDLLQVANEVARNRNPNSLGSSIYDGLLGHAAEVSRDYLTKTYGSTPFLRATKAANLGVPAEVLGLIAYNEEITPFAQTLLCSATYRQSVRLDNEAKRFRLEEQKNLDEINRANRARIEAHNLVNHLLSVVDVIFDTNKTWSKVEIVDHNIDDAISVLWANANDALTLSYALEQNIKRTEYKDIKRIDHLSEIAEKAKNASLALAI